jgi:hypothetical protein
MPRAMRLQTLPGVGLLTSMTSVAEIADIARFPTARTLRPLSGLTPRVRNSDTKIRCGRISTQGTAAVRFVLGDELHAPTTVAASPADGLVSGPPGHRRGLDTTAAVVVSSILALRWSGPSQPVEQRRRERSRPVPATTGGATTPETKGRTDQAGSPNAPVRSAGSARRVRSAFDGVRTGPGHHTPSYRHRGDDHMRDGALRRGDLVEVRSAAEILPTLDEHGARDSMPFMPEMVAYCRRRFTVDRRAEKICDTINSTLQSRWLPNTVLLDELRCDGTAHGGCQAECRFFWNEVWLRKVEPHEPVRSTDDDPSAVRALLERVGANTRRASEDGKPRYRCQATEMAAASTPLSTTDPRPYIRELTSTNVSVRTFARVMARAAVMQPAHHFGVLRRPKGPNTRSPKSRPLDLQPGEWVRVKPREEIEATLTTEGSNRGLHFDIEMLPFCGQVLQVRGRVKRIVDERSGEMLEFGSDCVKLENAVCSGERSTGRWFCPREIYPYWRECWVERVDGKNGSNGSNGSAH